MTVTSIEEMQTAMRDVIDEALQGPALVEARAWANEVGIRAARRSVDAALGAHREAQVVYRQRQADEADAQAAYDAALSEAEWMLGDRFVTEGNKTFLVLASKEDGEVVRRQMTADERRSWIATEAQREPTVVAAATALRKAKDATTAARDDITHAELRVKAASGDRDAAVAELNLLSAALPRKESLA